MKYQKADIQYFTHPHLFQEYYNIIYQRLLPKKEINRVCELGAGGNPTLTQAVIEEQGLDYWVTDVSEKALANCADTYQKKVIDVQQKDISTTLGKFDLIFSKMLVEHLPHPSTFHRNIFNALSPNAYAFHFFPTLGSLTLWLNHLLPELLTKPLLMWAEPSRRAERFGKFSTYYHWCEGPSRSNMERFEELGFEVELYYGGYGHKYYERIAPLHWLEQQKSRVLQQLKWPGWTANACVLLKKHAKAQRRKE
ncbi:MAG: methyltransferase domain-containing protein [Bacteroidota bacterium]